MGMIRLIDVDRVEYVKAFPDQRDFEAADAAMELADRKGMYENHIGVFGDRIGIALPSGDFLEYVYDYRTGELTESKHKDEFMKYWAMQFEEA